MPDRADIEWFKGQFGPRISAAIASTPYTLDFIVAIACQETGYLWARFRRSGMETGRILALCVGDTLDDQSRTPRRAFPRNRTELLATPNGQAMFDIARRALVELAVHVPDYRAAAQKPGKFCRGFGLFQRDLQYFKIDPAYFLDQRYATFEDTLDHALQELASKQRILGLTGSAPLSVLDMMAIAVAYNTGRFKPGLGPRQGHRSPNGRYYGEQILDYLRLSATASAPGETPRILPPSPGEAIVPPPSLVEANGAFFRVDTRISSLYLRSEPRISSPPRANVVGELPDGHPVQALSGTPDRGFMAVATSLNGALLRGYCAVKFLRADAGAVAIPVVMPAPAPPTKGIRAVSMPAPSGWITKRTSFAGAHSLNEPGRPGRTGTDAGTLRQEIANIIAWLDVEKPAHKRYQPRDGLTFCNIYCHDFCHLAGAYLPRVWWTSTALIALSEGHDVAPLIGNTIREMRANDLFRWLRDFGPLFGWRQTGTLTKLQLSANQGALGIIVARRKEDGRSGHIGMVIPETGVYTCRRDANGEVIAPLQSQAGTDNFRCGTSQRDWWKHEKFAEWAFWIHA